MGTKLTYKSPLKLKTRAKYPKIEWHYCRTTQFTGIARHGSTYGSKMCIASALTLP